MNGGKWGRRTLTFGVALALGLSSCASPAPQTTAAPSAPTAQAASTPTPTAKQPFTLPVDTQGTWNPYLGSRSINMTLTPLLYDSLYQLDPAFAPQPLLAQGAQVSEDGLTWRVTLKSGVTFSDGTPMDAKAVCAALIAAKGEASLYAQRLRTVQSITADGENTVVFRLNSPNKDFLALLDIPIALVAKDGVFGTGRYVTDGERLTLRADGWQETGGLMTEIGLTRADTAEELIAAFDDGTLGLTASDPTGADAPGFSGSYQTWEYPTSTMLYLGFRNGGGVCRSAEVRAALSRGIDRSGLVNGVLGGHASVATLPVPPTAKKYDQTAAKGLEYDVTAAAEALDALGFVAGEDGIRRRGREELRLTLLVNADNNFKGQAADAIAENLNALGAAVTVTRLPWEEYKRALERGEFDLYLGECRLTGDFDLTAFFTAGSGLCYGGAPARELADSFAAARAEGDWSGFFALYAQEPPFVTLCFKTGAVLTRWGEVNGLTPTQGNLFYRLENWVFQN